MWRSRMFWRLFAAYSLLLTASLGVLGLFMMRRLETHLLDDIRQSLETRTILVREVVNAQPHVAATSEAWQPSIRRLGEEIQARITLIAADGQVLADSVEDPTQMENHRDRPEILQAATAGVGTATRFSETTQQPMMYLARRTDTQPVRYVRLALPLGAVDTEVHRLHWLVWTATGATLLLTLCLSLLLTRRIVAPLLELADAARSVARGEYGTRVRMNSKDELGTLALAFNEMSQASADHIAQMEHDREQLRTVFRSMVEGVLVLDAEQGIQFQNEAASRLLNLPADTAPGRKLWQLIRHRQLTEAVERILASEEPHRCELEWQSAERKVLAVHGRRLPGTPVRGAVLVLHDITHLRKLEQVRQDFVANVSHELKTPLAAIQAMVETLLDGALHDPEHNVRFLQHIAENAGRLNHLVQDLLSLARIESGDTTPEVEPVPVQAVVDGCLGRLEARATAAQLQLIQEPPDEALHVMANEEALCDILENLLDNAIKYTPLEGRIVLRWFADGSEVALEVKDTGIGISEKDLSRIFERFYRVDKARSRALGGTGLGLSIVKHLAQALGGSVTATSQVGVGSSFTVRLPRVM